MKKLISFVILGMLISSCSSLQRDNSSQSRRPAADPAGSGPQDPGTLYAVDYINSLVLSQDQMQQSMSPQYHPNSYEAGAFRYLYTSELPKPTAPRIVVNANGSRTVFYATIDDLFSAIDGSGGPKISNLVIVAFGIPGGVIVPTDATAFGSPQCGYYTNPQNVTAFLQDFKKIMLQRDHFASHPKAHYPCETGVSEWKSIAAKHPHIGSAFTSDVKVRLVSDTLGRGITGQAFVESVPETLGLENGAQVAASLQYLSADWSTFWGTTFWDYKKPSDITPQVMSSPGVFEMQPGTLRVVSYVPGKGWTSTLLKNHWIYQMTGDF